MSEQKPRCVAFEVIKMADKVRDYRREYDQYHGTPEQIANRSQRNQARADLGLKVGNPKECDHKNPISSGGTNSPRNLRAVSRDTNRGKGSSK